MKFDAIILYGSFCRVEITMRLWVGNMRIRKELGGATGWRMKWNKNLGRWQENKFWDYRWHN